jgi:hypothetical protein
MFLLSIPLALVSFLLMIGAWWLSPILSFIILRISEGKQKAKLIEPSCRVRQPER